MKLIKLQQDHFIIADDSQIKEGDWFLSKEGIIHNNFGWNFGDKKITHSTQPLDKSLFFTNRIWGCEKLNLGEVKELIGDVDVENKAEEKYPKSEFWVGSNPSRLYHANVKERRCFIEGYNQALKDNKGKKYTEKDIDKAYWAGMQFVGEDKGSFGEFIQSLQPKTEWEVEIVDGKFKLK